MVGSIQVNATAQVHYNLNTNVIGIILGYSRKEIISN